MAYEVIALDLDGTLTNSQKVITEPTRRGLIELQKSGKTVVLASGRPINGVVYLAEELDLSRYGGYTLSFNGARITRCSDGAIIRNQTLPPEVIRPIWNMQKGFPAWTSSPTRTPRSSPAYRTMNSIRWRPATAGLISPPWKTSLRRWIVP